MTTISIVTPSYNQGPYIEETLASVLSQEGDFFIQYIVMDGGSTDGTVNILKKTEEKIRDGRWNCKCKGIDFKWVSGKDEGQTHAINKGFSEARGEIVSWINSDDLYMPGAFRKVAEIFAEHPGYDFIFGDGEVIDEKGMLQWEWLSRPYHYSLLKSYHFAWNDFTNYILQQATFWRKSVFHRIGMLDESLHYAMDIEYWLRMGRNGLKAVHIPAKLGKFRLIQGTKSLSSPTIFWEDSLQIFLKYNGAKKMEPFLRFYFYNLGLHNDFQRAPVEMKAQELLKQWEIHNTGLSEILKKKAKIALCNSFNMMAYRVFLKGEKPKARPLFARAISGRPFRVFHPLSLRYLATEVMGIRNGLRINRLAKKIIQKYREKKYLYRYVEREK